MMLLKNKVVIITGSNRGIGKCILETFSSNGADIYACARKIDKKFLGLIKNLKKLYKNNITPIQIDMLDEKSIKKAGKKILRGRKKIDVLINNAGIMYSASFHKTSLEKFKEIFQINLFSQILFTHYILKSMIKKKSGSVIFISSNLALNEQVGRSAFSSSKAAIISLSKTLSREFGKKNIRVNTIAPGFTKNEKINEKKLPNNIKKYISSTFLKRLAKPDEIANIALFLSSDKSKFITGQTIRADGGL